jgi:general secretion pathway protein N
MFRSHKFVAVSLLSGAMLGTSFVPQAVAATSSTLDILSSDAAGEPAVSVDVGGLRPISKAIREGGKPAPSGNPLWAIPLSVLTSTQERPIFLASRRPPQRAVVALQADPVVPPPPKPAEPEHPPLALIGAVVAERDAIAVFLDRTSQKIVRLRQGEAHAGWVLKAILPREVILKRDDRTEVLALRPPVSAPAAPGLVLPAAAATGTQFAPFVPRSTPKNGESDGL